MLSVSFLSGRIQLATAAVAVLVMLGGMGFGGPASDSVSAETWTNLTGTHQVEAEMVGLWGDTVILQRADGTRVSVKLETLRADSRIQARRLADQIAEARKTRVAELKSQLASGGIPAPEPLPAPPATEAYTPPAQDSKIGEFLSQINAALEAGHVRVLYDALPPTYRDEIRKLLQEGAAKMNETTWNSLVKTPQRLGELIVTRQNWLFSSPRFQNFAPPEQERVKEALLGIGNVLRQGLDAGLINREDLQSEEFDQILDRWDQRVAPYVAEAMQKSEIDLDALTQVVSEDEETAVVAIGAGDEAVEQTYQRVEGFWISDAQRDSLDESIAAYKQQIADAADGKLLANEALLVSAINPLLDSLADAESADAFHRAFDAVLTPLQTMLPPGVLSPAGSEPTAEGKSVDASAPAPADDASQDTILDRLRAASKDNP